MDTACGTATPTGTTSAHWPYIRPVLCVEARTRTYADTTCAKTATTDLVLGVEVDAGLAVEVEGAAVAGLVAGEGEHGQGHGDGHVDAHLAGLDLELVLARGRSVVGEDGSAVAVPGKWGGKQVQYVCARQAGSGGRGVCGAGEKGRKKVLGCVRGFRGRDSPPGKVGGPIRHGYLQPFSARSDRERECSRRETRMDTNRKSNHQQGRQDENRAVCV